MRTLLPLIVALSLFLLNTSFVLAEDATSSTTPRERLLQKTKARGVALQPKVATRPGVLALSLEERKARIATREAELKEKLQSFRDKNKAKIVEKINTQLATVNKNRTDSMSSFLTRLENLLAKIESKNTEVGSSGKDVTAVTQAITDAKEAISKAKTAVAAQVEKTYIITLTEESQVRTDVKTTRDALHTDLFTTHKLVVEAKQSVANILSVAKSTLGDNQ